MRQLILAALLSLSSHFLRPAAAGDMHPVPLAPFANQPLDGAFGRAGKGNNLARLPKGEQRFGEATFEVGERMLQLGSRVLDQFPNQIDGIAVDRACTRIHFLHSTLYGGAMNASTSPNVVVQDDVLIGEYIVRYEDGNSEGIPIIYGRDVRDWWVYPGESPDPSHGKVAWQGQNEVSVLYGQSVRVYSSVWNNPFPGKRIRSIDFVGRKHKTVAAPFCIAITLEDPPVGALPADKKASPEVPAAPSK